MRCQWFGCTNDGTNYVPGHPGGPEAAPHGAPASVQAMFAAGPSRPIQLPMHECGRPDCARHKLPDYMRTWWYTTWCCSHKAIDPCTCGCHPYAHRLAALKSIYRYAAPEVTKRRLDERIAWEQAVAAGWQDWEHEEWCRSHGATFHTA